MLRRLFLLAFILSISVVFAKPLYTKEIYNPINTSLADCSNVTAEPTLVYEDGVFHMWFRTCTSATGGEEHIQYWNSTDGINFGEPINVTGIGTGIAFPRVMKMANGTYYLYATNIDATQAVSRWESTNKINWSTSCGGINVTPSIVNNVNPDIYFDGTNWQMIMTSGSPYAASYWNSTDGCAFVQQNASMFPGVQSGDAWMYYQANQSTWVVYVIFANIGQSNWTTNWFNGTSLNALQYQGLALKTNAYWEGPTTVDPEILIPSSGSNRSYYLYYATENFTDADRGSIGVAYELSNLSFYEAHFGANPARPPDMVGVYLAPLTPYPDNNLTAGFNASDADSALVNVTIHWYKNDVLQNDLNETLVNIPTNTLQKANLSAIGYGNEWYYDAVATDGTLTSPTVVSNNITTKSYETTSPCNLTNYLYYRTLTIDNSGSAAQYSFNVTVPDDEPYGCFTTNASGTETTCNGFYRLRNQSDYTTNYIWILNCSLANGETRVNFYYGNTTQILLPQENNISKACTIGDSFDRDAVLSYGTWASAVSSSIYNGSLKTNGTAGKIISTLKPKTPYRVWLFGSLTGGDVGGNSFLLLQNTTETQTAGFPWINGPGTNYYAYTPIDGLLTYSGTNYNVLQNYRLDWNYSTIDTWKNGTAAVLGMNATTGKVGIVFGTQGVVSASQFIDWVCLSGYPEADGATFSAWSAEMNLTNASTLVFVSPTPTNGSNNFTYGMVFNFTSDQVLGNNSYIEIDGTNYTCTLATGNLSCSYTLSYDGHLFNNTYDLKAYANVSDTYYTNDTAYSFDYYGCGTINQSGNMLGNVTSNTSTTCFTVNSTVDVTFIGNEYYVKGNYIGINASTNTTISSIRFSNNEMDLVIEANSTLSGAIFDNPIAGFTNFTNLSMTDTISGESYLINWSVNTTLLPTDYFVFRQFIGISDLTGSASIDSLTWNWVDAELESTFNESSFRLFQYNTSAWILLNYTPDTTSDALITSSLSPQGIYGILQSNFTAYFTVPTLADGSNTSANIELNITGTSAFIGCNLEIDGTNQTGTMAGDNLSCSYTISSPSIGHTYDILGWENNSFEWIPTNETRSITYYAPGPCLQLLDVFNITQNESTYFAVGSSYIYIMANITLNNTCAANITDYDYDISDSIADASWTTYLINISANEVKNFSAYEFRVVASMDSNGPFPTMPFAYYGNNQIYNFTTAYTRNITMTRVNFTKLGDDEKLYVCETLPCDTNVSSSWTLVTTGSTSTDIYEQGDYLYGTAIYIQSYHIPTGGGGGGGGGAPAGSYNESTAPNVTRGGPSTPTTTGGAIPKLTENTPCMAIGVILLILIIMAIKGRKR